MTLQNELYHPHLPLSPYPALLVPGTKHFYTIGCKNTVFKTRTLLSKYHNKSSNSFINYSKCCLLYFCLH